MNVPVSHEDGSRIRLPQPLTIKAFDGLQGKLLLRPWYDWCGVRAIVNWYFPLSRAWAAALEADGDLEGFNNELMSSFPASSRMQAALTRTAAAHQAYHEHQERWEEGFFGGFPASESERVKLEVQRQSASKHRMMCRKLFLPWRRKFPKLHWAIPHKEDVEQHHGGRLLDPASAFEVPALPQFEISRDLKGAWDSASPYRQYWLRYPSLASGEENAVLADEGEKGKAWAKVYEPEQGGEGAPCLIFLHGIGMETDLWGELSDPVNLLTKQGVRVIRPEAPWHAHRRLRGRFGGEPAIAQGPLGFIELFHAWVTETAQLIAWARQNGASQVAVGGLSLGALTAQLVATRARNWAPAQQPDRLLLVTTSEDMLDIALHGSMARLLDMPRHFAAAGWTEEDLARWTPLLEPHGEPVMTPGEIVVLLGRADDLTPVRGGESLLRRWKVPENNVFRRSQGHFSASLGLYRDNAVLQRLVDTMRT